MQTCVTAIRKLNAIGMVVIARGLYDFAYCSAPTERVAGASANFHHRHHLRADRQNEVSIYSALSIIFQRAFTEWMFLSGDFRPHIS